MWKYMYWHAETLGSENCVLLTDVRIYKKKEKKILPDSSRIDVK